MKTNPKVDRYFSGLERWRKELERLRAIFRDSGLNEELKWGKPCYTYQDGNIAVLCALKESCAIGFLKGSLLKDAGGILTKPGENSQSMRWLKFTSVEEIAAKKALLKAYIREAIEAEKAGLKVEFKKDKLVFPDELKKVLKKNPAFKEAFTALTPGRQRGYNLFFSGAKQSATREARIEKCTPRILNGKGLHD